MMMYLNFRCNNIVHNDSIINYGLLLIMFFFMCLPIQVAAIPLTGTSHDVGVSDSTWSKSSAIRNTAPMIRQEWLSFFRGIKTVNRLLNFRHSCPAAIYFVYNSDCSIQAMFVIVGISILDYSTVIQFIYSYTWTCNQRI